MENDEGDIVGTVFITTALYRAAAIAITEQEPFHKAGIFESVIILRWRQMQPEMVPGAKADSAIEAGSQFREDGQE